MCQPSVIADDWVVKGFHIHVGAIELVVRPDHTGRVVFRGFFSGDDPDDVDRAIRIAGRDCLPDPQVRDRWLRDARRAMSFLRTYRGELEARANGRLLEFRFLIRALERYEG